MSSNIFVFDNRAKEILAMQDSLQEIVQLVGKESLSEDQKVSLTATVPHHASFST